MPKAKFYYGTKGQLDDKNIENGALYMTTDEEKWYVDMDGERHLLSQGTEFEDRIVFDGSVPFFGILTLNGYPAIPLFTFEYTECEELENQAIGYTVKVYLKNEDYSPNGYIYWAGAEFITSFAPGALSSPTSQNSDGILSTYGHSLGGVTDYLSSQVEIGPQSIATQKANSLFSATVFKGPTGPYNVIFNLSWMELSQAYNALATVGPFSNKKIEYPKTSLDILVTANVIMASNEAQFTNITYKDPKTNTIEDSGNSIPQVFMTGNVATLAYKSDEATIANQAENDSYGNDIGNYIKLLYARSDKNKVSIVSTRGAGSEATTNIPAYSDTSAGVVPAYDTPGEILYTSGWGPAPSTDGSDLTGIVPIAKGGTGADDAAEARANLGITPGNIGAATASHTHTTSQVTGLDNELQEIRDLIDEVEAGTSGDYTSLQQAVNNLTSLVNTKQNIITGAATTIDTENLTANRALVSDASGKVAVSAVTSTELGYLDGVTSNVQTQLNGKAPTSHNHVSTNITGDANSVAVFDTTGTLCGSSSITTGELDMLNGVTSNIQTQLNNKAATDHDHDASDITSGILAAARIPNLDAGKITSGTFAAARIPGLDASKITSGTISIDRLPQAALERLVIVADDTARFKLTTSQVQNGDVVKVTSSGKMYFVKDQNELDNANGYEEFAAGTAASVSWNNITGKPSTFTPSSHTHQYAGSASVGGPANSVANALTISLNGTSQGAYNGSAAKSIDVTPASIGAATSGHTHNAATTSAAGFMSAADKAKLDGISTSADANQNAFSNVKVGSTTIAADTTTDTLTLVAGSNVTITPDAATDKITIAATDTKYSNATTGTSGLMSATDKAKLDGITASADSVAFSRSLTSGTKVGTITINGTATDLYAPTNTDTKYSDMVGATTSTAGTHGLVPAPAAGAATRYLRSDGTWQVPPNTTYGVATTGSNGLMSAADKTKLDGIATGANKYTHPSYTTRSSGLYKITVDATGHVSGATAVTKSDIVALGIPAQDTNTTYTLGSFGITATATELNYCDGVTSNIQTQLNSKAPSSHIHNYAGSSSAGGAANSANMLNEIELTSQDLNNYRDGVHFYYAIGGNTCKNKPSGVDNFGMFVFRSAGGWYTQMLYGSNRVVYTRHYTSSSWTAWVGAYSTSNKPTASEIGAAAASHNHSAANITSGTLTVARGGTGLSASPSMLVNLASTSADTVFEASPRPGVTGTLGIANGGTGATTAAQARTNLGFTLGNLGVTASAAELNKLDGATVSVTEINYLDGVTSNIQTQLNGKASSSHSHSYLPLSGGTLTGNLTARTITPAADSTYNLGSSSVRYANVYADTFTGSLSGNATTATTATHANRLTTARTINGTSFNGSANITTANWGTARTITIGNTGKSVNGSASVSWSLSEIGAASSSHTHSIYNKTTVGTGAPSGTGNAGDIYIDLNTGTVYRWS